MARKTRCIRLSDEEYEAVKAFAIKLKQDNADIKLKDLRKLLKEKPDIVRLMMHTSLTAKEIEAALAMAISVKSAFCTSKKPV